MAEKRVAKKHVVLQPVVYYLFFVLKCKEHKLNISPFFHWGGARRSQLGCVLKRPACAVHRFVVVRFDRVSKRERSRRYCSFSSFKKSAVLPHGNRRQCAVLPASGQ